MAAKRRNRKVERRAPCNDPSSRSGVRRRTFRFQRFHCSSMTQKGDIVPLRDKWMHHYQQDLRLFEPPLVKGSGPSVASNMEPHLQSCCNEGSLRMRAVPTKQTVCIPVMTNRDISTRWLAATENVMIFRFVSEPTERLVATVVGIRNSRRRRWNRRALHWQHILESVPATDAWVARRKRSIPACAVPHDLTTDLIAPSSFAAL